MYCYKYNFIIIECVLPGIRVQYSGGNHQVLDSQVIEAITKPAGELENAHRMMQLHVDLLLSKPIAQLIVHGLRESDPTVSHDPIEFVTVVLNEVPEFGQLTKITRRQIVKRACGCPGVSTGDSRDVEEHVRKRVVQGSDKGVLSTDQVWNFDLSGHIGDSDEKCPERRTECKGGVIHQKTTHPPHADEYPPVLMFHVAGGKYTPQLQFTPLEGLHYSLRSWTQHVNGGTHHVAGVMMPERVSPSTITTNIRVDDSDVTICQNLPIGVSVAFYERITDVTAVVSSGLPAITKDICFKKDIQNLVREARRSWQKITNPRSSSAGGTATSVRTSPRTRRQTKTFVPT